jgi:pimeloyl-ACP methyl ester carboxylesterase
MAKAHVNGIEINYETHGDAGPWVVLAHGYTASMEMWRDHVAALSEKRRLLIYDTRGHGATTAPEDLAQYDLARDYVADQAALMDHLGIERAHIGGLSMGGMIAQEFALQHPQRVVSLLLFDTGPGGGPADAARAAQFTQMREMMRGIARTKGMGAIIDAMRNSPMWQARAGGGAVPEAVRRHVEGMRQMNVDGYLGGADAMRTWAGTTGRLASISAPTLVLVGENDALLPASRTIHAQIPGSRFVLIRESTHGTCMWKPREFIDATLGFLDDAEAGRPVAGEVTA